MPIRSRRRPPILSIRGGLLAAALLLVALPSAACDSDPEPEPQVSAPSIAAAPPQASFSTEADTLCREAQAEQERIRRQRGGDQITLSDRARLLVELAPARVRLAEQLAGLPPPVSVGQAERADQLVAAARRRGVASAEAGERWQRDAERELIAEAAAREHDERVRFVRIAEGLGLRACAEQLEVSEAAEIERLVRRSLTDPDALVRCSGFGSRYLEQEFGGGRAACAAAGGPTRADRVGFGGIAGMDEIFAVARATTVGGGRPEQLRLRITFEDGGYRIDKVD